MRKREKPMKRGYALLIVCLLLTIAGCGLLSKPKPSPTIREMEAAIRPVVKAELAPVIEAQGDVSQQLTTLQETITETTQGINALKQEVGSIGTQTIVSADPKVIAEVRQVGVETVKALTESLAASNTIRSRLDARLIAAVIGLVILLLFLPGPATGIVGLVGQGIGIAILGAAILMMIL